MRLRLWACGPFALVCNLEAHRCFAAPVGRRRRFAGLPLTVPDCSKVTGSSSKRPYGRGLTDLACTDTLGFCCTTTFIGGEP